MKKYLLLLFIVFITTILYSIYIEPLNYKINEYTINVSNTSCHYDDIKIVHFTDTMFNDKTNFSMANKITKDINKINPTIIIFTGNLISKDINDKTKEEINKLLSSITIDAYKYAILDKYDNDTSKDLLANNNYTIIDNSSLYFFHKDINPILIASTNDLENIPLPEENLNHNLIFLLLKDADDFNKINSTAIPLVAFAGNLGGEIRIPFYEGLIKNDGNKNYNNTYYYEDNKQLYVSYGIGTSKLKMRFLNKPSFNIYRIKTK